MNENLKNPDQITEDLINSHLANAFMLFNTLYPTHPCHTTDFCDGIHKCQQIIMWRELQRINPDKYPIKK